ncbi:zinc finger protein 469 [Hippopotamus amphibius kiboko]|uniref:zinc finger protein 469 n=1 Tax=Hippopotamus amphibius kiboko TaxID=575201 RepID=UPI002593AC0E|nr:zinc finger protein 469 [Hippopotamus amphibius kiboko]
MPGEQPLGAPPPTMTGDLQPCPAASGKGAPPPSPSEVSVPATRTLKATGSRAQAVDASETQVRQAGKVGPKVLLPRAQALSRAPGKGGSPQAPAGSKLAQPRARRAGRSDGSPQQLYSLSIASSRPKPALDEKTPEGPRREAPRPPEVEAPPGQGNGARHGPGRPRAVASPGPQELGFPKCFQETPSGCTASPGPPPLRAPGSSSASARRLVSYVEFQARGADAWPPPAEDSFPGARFGVAPPEPEPFPAGGSPGVAAFQFPFPELHGAGPKPFPEDAGRALARAFHQPRGAWPEEPAGTGPAYPPPARPAPRHPPCYPGPPGGLGGALPPPGAAHPAPGPFSENTAAFRAGPHAGVTTALPERPPSAHDGLGSPGGPPHCLAQRQVPTQAYGSPAAGGAGTGPGPRDAELTVSGPAPARLPQRWDPPPAPHPTPPLGPPATAGSAFFEAQPSPGQRLSLPQSPPLPWPQVLPAAGPTPHQMEMRNRLPFRPGVPEWQAGSQGALGATSKTPGPGETLTVLRSSPGRRGGGSPGLFTYNGLKDPGAQPLFFGAAQPQASPRGPPGLPPPRVVGASPSESPLPSPATHTASSTCSSLSPLSSSPANPSSDESQLPGPLGPSAFFHPPTHPQETGSPFPPPEGSRALPVPYQPEPVKAFPFPTEGLEETPFPSSGLEAGSAGLEGFPQEPPPYSAHHFPLSSASLDQLDVLLTCRQCDRNYSSLAAFLGHRQFCSLLPARAKGGRQQPPGLPAAPAAPSALAAPKAPGRGTPSPLSHARTAPFLLGGDVRPDGRDDPLRTSFLPGLATAPFALPAGDLDLEDAAKLDSLITEALNGLEYQSDSPEIDSSFIDVFTDEEPSGPRGPAAGQPPKTRLGATPEDKAQAPLPAADAPLGPQPPQPGDGGYPAGPRPKTRSLGPAPAEADAAGLGGQQRRGKRFKLFRKELDTVNTAKRPGRGSRAARLRPRRRGRAEHPPSRPRDLRTQAPRSHTDPGGRALPVETRSSRRLRLSPGKDCRRRQARGGTWSKELIHKIVQQKNRAGKRGPAPGAEDGGPQDCDCASESEEEDGPRPRGSRVRSQPCPNGRRWRRGEKRKEVDLTPGPREDGQRQKPRKVVRQEAARPGGSPGPEELGRPWPGPTESPKAQGPSHSPETRAAPEQRGPQHLPQALTGAKTPEESHPPPASPQDPESPRTAEELPPDATKLRGEALSASPASCGGGGPCPPRPERLQPRGEEARLPLARSPTRGAARCSEPAVLQDGEAPPASLPGDPLAPVASADTAYPEPSTLFLKTPGLGDSAGVPATERGPQPCSSPPRELFLEPKDLAGDFHTDLGSQSSAPDSPPAIRVCLRQGGEDASSKEPKPPRNPPYMTVAGPGKAEWPPALEPGPLFPGLPRDGFDLPIYGSLSGNGDTHVPCACAAPPPRKPQLDPLYPSFLPEKGWCLLEDVSSVPSGPPGPFPSFSGEKASHRKHPSRGTVASSLPASSDEAVEGSTARAGGLSEAELEIKRLVTELESQLHSRGAQEAPREPSRAHVPSPRGPRPHPEETEAAVATTGGTLGRPREAWLSFHPEDTALAPSTHEDMVPGGPFSPTGASLRFQPVQKDRVSKAGLPGARPQVCLPDPPLDVWSLTQCSPHPEPLLPEGSRATRTQHSQGLPLLPPCPQGGGLSPGPCMAPGPCRDPPEPEALGSPVAQLPPGLALRGGGLVPLGATSPSGASHSSYPKGHSVSSTAGPGGAGLPPPVAGGPGPEGKEESVPAGASPSRACVPRPSPGPRPQAPASSPLHQLQLLVARAAETDDAQGSQGPPPADAQSPQHSDPLDLGGDSVEGGKMARSPARGFPGGVQTTAVPAVAGRHLGPERDGRPGSRGQAGTPKGHVEAGQLQPRDQGRPGQPDDLATARAGPETTAAGLAGATDQLEGQLQGSRAAVGLWNGPRATPSPTSSEAEPSVPAWAVANTQEGPENQTPEAAAGPGLEKHLLFAGESPAAPTRDLASCTPSPTSAATPNPYHLEPLPKDTTPAAPSGELEGLHPAPLSCRGPASPQLLPAGPSAWAPPKRANCTPAPTDAGAPLAVPPSVRTSPCGLLEDPPKEPSFISVFTPARGGDCPADPMARTLEGSRKERPREAPACATLPHPAGATSPRATVKAAALPDTPSTGGLGTVRGPRAEWPGPGRAPSNTHPDGVPEGSSAEPPGNSEGQGVTAVPPGPSTRGAAGPDPHTCQEGEAEASLQGQEGLETPGAGRPAVTEAPRAATRGLGVTSPSAEPHPGRTTPLSSTAGASGPHAPQSLGNVLHQRSQGDPLRPQDPRQKPRGFKKEPVFTENGHWRGGAPSGRPATCEVCSACFCSGPGLSRHRARKHGLHGRAASQPSPTAPPAPQTHHPPGKKSRRAPGKEKPRHVVREPSQAGGPPPGSVASEVAQGPDVSKGLRRGLSLLGAPGCPPGWEPQPPDVVKQGVDMRPAEPRKWDQPQRDEPRPTQAGRGGGQRRGRPPADLPSESEGKSSGKARKPRARRCREESGPQVPAGVTSGRRRWNPSAAVGNGPALPSRRRLSPEAEQEAEATQPPLLPTDLEETAAQKSPGDWVACPGMVEGAPPGERPAGRKAAPARGCGGPRGTRTPGVCKEPSRAAGDTPTGDSRVDERRSGQGVWEGPEPPRHVQGPPEMRGAEAGGPVSSCLQDPLHSPGEGIQEQEGTVPEAPSPDLRDPLSLFDDEASFSQLFPLGDRLARKKNPRVYGKRCRKSKPPPRPEPSSRAEGSVALSSARLPTDLSDSGSLCLSHEDPWGDEAAGLPESFLLEGFLSSKVPGIDPWAPGPSPWALEPHPEVDPCCAEDHLSENIPELHMVPAAWRGLELRAPADEATSSPGDTSPEPPDLVREQYDCSVPGSAADLEIQDLCFLGPREDPVRLPGASCSGLTATAASPGGPQGRTEEEAAAAAGAGRAPGGGRPAKARRASHKCRVCFQRFHGLGELDLHKLAHSPSPPPTCYMCVARRFGSRELLREHLQEKHVQSKAGLWACGMCRREVADVWMYNEHLREHAARFARRGPARAPPGEPPARAAAGAPRARRAAPRPRAGDPPRGAPPPPPPAPRDRRDPARDCHHCGKRFPKPFKLQRHLAVHSARRVYLCPRCPRVYPAPRELRAHLGGAHGLRGPLELPHTPLFACELCADVAHISRRSFACSACNYTFAKKEQFDRHMDKHRRTGPRPFAFRGVRRPGAPGHKGPAREGSLPGRRRGAATPGGSPGAGVDAPPPRGGGGSPALSEASLPAPLPPCPEAAPGTPAGPPGTPERPGDPVGRLAGGGDPASDLPELLPPSLSPFPAASADGRDGHKPGRALESCEDEASPGSPGRLLQQALPLGGSLPRPGAGGQDVKEKRAAGPFSGKHRTPSAPGTCAPDQHPEAPSLLRKEKQVSTCLTAPAGGTGGPSHRGSATKPGGCRSSSKDRSASSTPSKAPKLPVQLKKAVAGPTPGELPCGTEDRLKPTALKVKPGPSSQGAGGPRQGTKAAGGSQPQPASGQLQSETATTPAKPNCPGQGPAPDKAPPRAPAKGCPKGPREADDQGPRGSLGPREDGDSNEKKRKGRAPGPARSEGAGSLGRGLSVPDKPPRAPRKQATPSRVLPAKPKPSSQNGTMPPQPSEPRKGGASHTHGNTRRGREVLGKALPQARPLHRPPRRGGTVHGAEPPDSRACRTAESQSHLLSQLFGQRLTSFKIPLKKDSSE